MKSSLHKKISPKIEYCGYTIKLSTLPHLTNNSIARTLRWNNGLY